MATYAIGDIQGCFGALRKLLAAISFDPEFDRLWLVGDLVNRGPESLATLRFVKGLGEAAITVLGNHDLHLLMVASNLAKPKRNDTLGEILAAPDRDELLCWLRQQPLLHADGNYAMVHAGLLPSWDLAKAASLAREAEAALRAGDYRDFLAELYGDQPDTWSNELSGAARLRVVVNAFTRLRLCSQEGRMEFSYKGEPERAPRGYLPWFDMPDRASRANTIIFGHWSALGLRVRPNLLALDSGCQWGGSLSAVRLEDRQVFQVGCHPPGCH
ncbi:MAG: symmetrical bis(5'-nucleosyl)-tetraphosphatase [Burkholderiales bacterium]|nr:symmetrical bis(5'-nucleosyl)-tetraphosphatase [Burkholderiales bacterium]